MATAKGTYNKFIDVQPDYVPRNHGTNQLGNNQPVVSFVMCILVWGNWLLYINQLLCKHLLQDPLLHCAVDQL